MKVMIIDTVGTQFPDYFRAYFPHVKIKGYDLTNEVATHPHGWMCGYYATVLLNLLPGNHEVVYVRIFDSNGTPIPKSNELILEILAQERPNIVSNSWGQHDMDTAWGERIGAIAWQSWAQKYNQLCNEIGCASFWAAGNNDSNDSDQDIDFPQRLIPNEQNCIIGSHRRNGIPSEFSGDGQGVFCTFWAENVQLLAGDHWAKGSGTSFACPKAAGLAAYLMRDGRTFKNYVKQHASKPDYWNGEIPHAKWGYGSLEHKYQEVLSMLDESKQPPRVAHISSSNFWHDLERI